MIRFLKSFIYCWNRKMCDIYITYNSKFSFISVVDFSRFDDGLWNT